jgi:hypothetical protein
LAGLYDDSIGYADATSCLINPRSLLKKRLGLTLLHLPRHDVVPRALLRNL